MHHSDETNQKTTKLSTDKFEINGNQKLKIKKCLQIGIIGTHNSKLIPLLKVKLTQLRKKCKS